MWCWWVDWRRAKAFFSFLVLSQKVEANLTHPWIMNWAVVLAIHEGLTNLQPTTDNSPGTSVFRSVRIVMKMGNDWWLLLPRRGRNPSEILLSMYTLGLRGILSPPMIFIHVLEKCEFTIIKEGLGVIERFIVSPSKSPFQASVNRKLCQHWAQKEGNTY